MSMVLMTSSKVLIAFMVLLLVHDVTCDNEDNSWMKGTGKTFPVPSKPATVPAAPALEAAAEPNIKVLMTEVLKKLTNIQQAQGNVQQELQNQETLLRALTQHFQEEKKNRPQENVADSLNKTCECDTMHASAAWNVSEYILVEVVKVLKTTSDHWKLETTFGKPFASVMETTYWEPFAVFVLLKLFFWCLDWIIICSLSKFLCILFKMLRLIFRWDRTDSAKAEAAGVPGGQGALEVPQAADGNQGKTQAAKSQAADTNKADMTAKNKCQTCGRCGRLRADCKVTAQQCMEPHGPRSEGDPMVHFKFLQTLSPPKGFIWVAEGLYSEPLRLEERFRNLPTKKSVV